MSTYRSSIKIDREITHQAHPHHKLRLEYSETPFDCHGCKEAGIGLKYRCQLCKYELHKVCGAAQPTVTHPFYRKCAFDFYYRPPDHNLRICDACQGDVSGFVYHCKCCDFDLHPCCVNLQQVLNDGQNNMLYLSAGLSGSCHHCGAKGPGWAYRSGQSKGYNLHVSCVKKLIVESWLASYFNVDKNKVQELQTRIPSLSGAPQKNGSGVRKYAQLAGGAVRVVMSALLGDPTAVLAGVVRGLISM
ncbi:hypothetical protein SAY86_028950 [Trapa natans]|uniref:Phorbol-ester/DAG-type domain-containing protein n=1 Tax=Trapa natans TaxID=22666 RepID=A0AAN7R936_TRANT|nr:hypothetical protein SAY86_028950 [Trapa natans]